MTAPGAREGDGVTARGQVQYCEVDGDNYELNRYHDRTSGEPYYRVRRLGAGGAEAEIVGRPGAWQARKPSEWGPSNPDATKSKTLTGAVCRLRELCWVGKYR